MGIADVALNKRPERPFDKKPDKETYLLKALLYLLLYVGKSKSPGVDGKLFFMDSEKQNSVSDVSPMSG